MAGCVSLKFLLYFFATGDEIVMYVPFSPLKAEKNISRKNIFKSLCSHAKLKYFKVKIKYVFYVFITLRFCFRFVFMALMEYCLVNIVLGDSDGPKPAPEAQKPDKVFDLAARVSCDVLLMLG
jgi:hypothetical protein